MTQNKLNNKFQNIVISKQLFTFQDKLLLAFSGGSDSVALAHLLIHAKYNFELAHCNFKLRNKEADGDQIFCENFAKTFNLKIHAISFDTKLFAKQNKLSIQMAARKLRYDWLQQIKTSQQINYILTAHHANDNLETILINITRGTGINGLKGIKEKQNDIIRPLIDVTKSEILDYIQSKQLTFRVDSSNQEVKYQRNLVRHLVIPQLEKLNSEVDSTSITSIKQFSQAAAIVNEYVNQQRSVLCKSINQNLFINIKTLLHNIHHALLLYEWLHPYGFNSSQVNQLITLLNKAQQTSGKRFVSDSHQVIINRDELIVSSLNVTNSLSSFIINSITDTHYLPIHIKFETVNNFYKTDLLNEAFIDAETLKFPLMLRKWKIGDYFYPLGMMRKQKLSDFFQNQKLALIDKQNVWLLCNNIGIIWIIGYRIDNRFKITTNTKHIIKISVA